MASGAEVSSLKLIPPWKFHVFLSFRGKDTRQSFTDYLYDTLQRNGIITFMDNEELKRGEVISEQLLSAIEESHYAIVVLSPNYASSSWCLDELVKIHECRKMFGKEVFPIFYDIDPADVLHQKGSFGYAFTKHEKKFKKDTIQRWRCVLRETANLFGWRSTNRKHTELIEEITAELRRKLQTELLAENGGLFGRDSRAWMVSVADVTSSSNSFKSFPQWKFQVFLNFRGPDTRGSFIDYLYETLRRWKIITFKDFENLEKGKPISQQLLQAIEESFCAIVVISPNYASSSFCLIELTKILECKDVLGGEVFPIFYEVEPSDVRHQKGSFGEAFKRIEKIYSEDHVQKWRDSLKRIANLSGWNSKYRHHTELIEEVILELRRKLQTKWPSYNDGLVGTDSRFKMSRSRTRCCVYSSHSYENPALPIPTGTIISTQGSSTAPPKLGTSSGSIDCSRIYVRPEGMELLPSPTVCHIISDIVNAKFTKPYLGWNEVPQDTRDLLWDEFEKECRWDPNHHGQIKKLWELKCADIIRALLASIRFDKVVGSWLSPTVLAGLREQWAKDSSQTNKDNLTVAEGDCVNRASFISISESNTPYTRELGRVATAPENFHNLNQNEETKHWKNERATRTYEFYEKLKSFIDAIGSSVDDSPLFYQDMGGRNKRARAYGFGSEVALYGLSGCSSESTIYPYLCSNDEISHLQSQLQEHQKERERLQNIESQFHNMTSELATVKDLVGRLVNRAGVQPESLLESHSSHSKQN